ncbi:MAG: aldehyde dehydrogenase [Rhodospirillales bacterium]|nr:aldehyde dehydrogenase [Rhodospirillales bacterium]
MFEANLLIGGDDVRACDGATFERRNPLGGAIATRAAAATVADAGAAADAAGAAFPGWAATGPKDRRAKLTAAADLIEKRAADFVAMMMDELGATRAYALFNVRQGVDTLREAAAMTTQVCGEVIPSDVPGRLAMTVRRPAGVVLGIAPWNAPLILGLRAVAMPLACGNTTVLKSSELSPGTHRLIGDAFRDAGLPPGTINVVSNAPADGPAVVEALIAHPAVRRVNFTGSTRIGRIIGEKAARHLKPALLELGGKAPLVVLEDADLDAAVAATAFGAYINQGQICMSTELAVVDDSVADAYVAKLAHKAASLPAGDPSCGDVVLGAMIDREAAQRVAALVDDAVGKGAVVAAGGTVEGPVMAATVLDRVTADMRIFHEESFGPVVSVVRAAGPDEAVRFANSGEYGLAAAVFGRDVGQALAVAMRIESGICHVNGATVHAEPQVPFGGVKASGYGRFGGKAGIEAFTELRWLSIATEAARFPF